MPAWPSSFGASTLCSLCFGLAEAQGLLRFQLLACQEDKTRHPTFLLSEESGPGGDEC